MKAILFYEELQSQGAHWEWEFLPNKGVTMFEIIKEVLYNWQIFGIKVRPIIRSV
jgi:hypothetical protein